MFKEMKQLLQLRSQMNEIKKRLDGMEVKVQSPKKYIEITISGSQEIKAVSFLQDTQNIAKDVMEQEIKEVINKAIKESQAMAAKTMSSAAGLGGMGGFGA